MFIFEDTGDVSFGPGVTFPHFLFMDNMNVTFEVLNDNISEDTEIGLFRITQESPPPFDRHKPLFRDVRIVIRNDEGNSRVLLSNSNILTHKINTYRADMQTMPTMLIRKIF